MLFILTLSPGGGGGLFATQFDDNNGDNKITSRDCAILNQTFDKLEFFSVLQFRAPMCVLAVFLLGHYINRRQQLLQAAVFIDKKFSALPIGMQEEQARSFTLFIKCISAPMCKGGRLFLFYPVFTSSKKVKNSVRGIKHIRLWCGHAQQQILLHVF